MFLPFIATGMIGHFWKAAFSDCFGFRVDILTTTNPVPETVTKETMPAKKTVKPYKRAPRTSTDRM